jgi:hypothetical protein
MARTKIWVGNEAGNLGDFNRADNWKPISLRNNLLKWTESVAQSGEYHVELAGGGDPSIEDPVNVQENGTTITEATVGSLAVSQWDYGDNDTLGYNTVYIRLSDTTDPDLQDPDFVTFTDVPLAGDTVVFENSSQDLLSGFDQSGLVLAALRIDKSYTGIFGTSAAPAYLSIGAPLVDVGYHFGPGTPAGSGQILLDLEDDANTTPTVVVHDTGQPTNANLPACRIIFVDTSGTIEVRKGSVGVASETNEVATVDTINVGFVTQKTTDANVYIGSGVTLETLEQVAGNVTLQCAVTTAATVRDGTLLTDGSGTLAVLNVKGGTVTHNGGTITTLNVTGGHIDFTKSDKARIITTPLLDYPGRMSYDIGVVTLTNEIKTNSTLAQGPTTYSATKV